MHQSTWNDTNQHWIPQFLLRGFGIRKKASSVYELDNQTKAISVREVKEAASKQHLLTDRDDAEVGKIENRAKEAVRAIGKGNLDHIGKDERQAVDKLVCAMMLDDPLAALFPRDAFALGNGGAEERADVSTSLGSTYGGTSAENLAARVFQGSAVSFLGIQTPTVNQPGSKTYNMILTGATADVRSPGVAHDSVAGTVRNTDISPARVTARMTVAREDIPTIPGLLQGWQDDLRGALMIERDGMVVNGQAAVNNVSPAVVGILMDPLIADPANPGDIATYVDYLNAFDDVDGYSDDGSNIRVITNATTFKHAKGLSVGPAASAFALLRDWAEMGPGRFRQSEAMPDTSAGNIGKAISARIGHRGAVSPIWNRIEIINDPYTNASEGLIHLTAYILTNVGIADPKVYRHLEYKTA